MKVSIVISACPNREKLFDNSLITLSKQKFNKKDFEIVLVDDGNNNKLWNLCEKYHIDFGLQFKYIKIDSFKSFYPAKSFTPALTNNIGFKESEGEIIMIAGPETMHAENNISIAYSVKNKKICAYGLVFRASKSFNKYLEMADWKKDSFSNIINYPGAQADCRTRPPHPPAYWYCVAVEKKHIFEIQGVDERFLEGICGEDDDFANRMKFLGITPVFEHKILGIHQNHDCADSNDFKHNLRNTNKWKLLKLKNIKYLNENFLSKDPVANKNHIWGDLKLITKRIILK